MGHFLGEQTCVLGAVELDKSNEMDFGAVSVLCYVSAPRDKTRAFEWHLNLLSDATQLPFPIPIFG